MFGWTNSKSHKYNLLIQIDAVVAQWIWICYREVAGSNLIHCNTNANLLLI